MKNVRYTTNRNHTQSHQCSRQTQFLSLLYDHLLSHAVISVLVVDFYTVMLIAHYYKSLQKLFSKCLERKTLNDFFSKLVFATLTFGTKYLNEEFSFWDNFFPEYPLFSPLCDAMKISKSRFQTLCMVSHIASQILLRFHFFS